MEGSTKQELEQAVIETSLKVEAMKKEMADLYKKLEESLKLLGIGHMFQSEDGTVFRVSKPAGVFTPYRDIDYDRTRREGEKSGSLSLTDARAAGYEVK
jgi:hypothetical protein